MFLVPHLRKNFNTISDNKQVRESQVFCRHSLKFWQFRVTLIKYKKKEKATFSYLYIYT